MQTLHHSNYVLVCAALMAFLALSPASQADEQADQTWDPRLNGIWKVTSVIQDGIPSEDKSDFKYAILDGVIVTAYPRGASFMPEPADGDGSPERKPLGKADSEDDDSLFPPPVSVMPSVPSSSKVPVVEFFVSKATIKQRKPYSWIDLEPQWEKGERWPGIYHIEGNTLTIASGEVRPTKLESPKVKSDGFTPPAPVSMLITLVRKPGTGSDEAVAAQEEAGSEK